MRITAELHNLRMSPRKVRLVADAIRGKRYPDAERTLHFLTRRAARPLEKLLRSAAANAKQNFEIVEPSQLLVSEVRVDAGATLKRQRARARGRAAIIRKRTSRITLVLETTGALAPRKKKSTIEVVRAPDSSTRAEGPAPMRPGPGRRTEQEHPRAVSKPTGFVQRMFRRKAI